MSATYLCPKCGQSMRQYRRTNGQQMVQCTDRRGCNLRVPLVEMGAPDDGLDALKPAPANPLDKSHLDSLQKDTHAPANFLPGIETANRNNSHRINHLYAANNIARASNHVMLEVSTLEQRSSPPAPSRKEL
jgi:hypothetical protein